MKRNQEGHNGDDGIQGKRPRPDISEQCSDQQSAQCQWNIIFESTSSIISIRKNYSKAREVLEGLKNILQYHIPLMYPIIRIRRDVEERERQECEMLWLINCLTKIQSLPIKQSEGFHENVTESIQIILEHTKNRQKWLFQRILKLYLKFTCLLKELWWELPVTDLRVMHGDENVLEKFHPGYKFYTIDIDGRDTLMTLMESNILYLAYSIGNVDELSFTSECFQTIADCALICDVNIKSICMEFFHEMFRMSDFGNKDTMTTILTTIDAAVSQEDLQQSCPMNCLERFFKTIHDLLLEIHGYGLKDINLYLSIIEGVLVESDFVVTPMFRLLSEIFTEEDYHLKERALTLIKKYRTNDSAIKCLKMFIINDAINTCWESWDIVKETHLKNTSDDNQRLLSLSLVVGLLDDICRSISQPCWSTPYFSTIMQQIESHYGYIFDKQKIPESLRDKQLETIAMAVNVGYENMATDNQYGFMKFFEVMCHKWSSEKCPMLGKLIACLANLRCSKFEFIFLKKLKVLLENSVRHSSNNFVIPHILQFSAQLIRNQLMSVGFLIEYVISKALATESHHEDLIKQLPTLICMMTGNCQKHKLVLVVAKSSTQSSQLPNSNRFHSNLCVKYLNLFNTTNKEARLHLPNLLLSILEHIPTGVPLQECLKSSCIFLDEDILAVNQFPVENILEAVGQSSLSADEKKTIIREYFKQIEIVTLSVMQRSKNQQQRQSDDVFDIEIRIFSTIKGFSKSMMANELLVDCLLLLIDCIMQKCGQAALCAQCICCTQAMSPTAFFNAHKQKILIKMVQFCVDNLVADQEWNLIDNWSSVAKVFGFSGIRDFLINNYVMVMTLLIPHAVKIPGCTALIDEVCYLIKKQRPILYQEVFNTLYIHCHIHEDADVAKKCIREIEEQTSLKAFQLFDSGFQCMANLLLYYHSHSLFVNNTFRDFHPGKEGKKITLIQYVTERFLGVFNYFGQIIKNEHEEHDRKHRTVLSLGAIIRLMGTKPTTQNMYKVVPFLKMAQQETNPDLRANCLTVWDVFLHHVDVDEIGPLLNEIYFGMEPLRAIPEFTQQVDDILKYLIISNGCLLSRSLRLLFFIQQTNAASEIQLFVTRQLQHSTKNATFLNQLEWLEQNIVQSEVKAQFHTIEYLTNLMRGQRRSDLNLLVLRNEAAIHKTLQSVVDKLVQVCKHTDEQLRLAAGTCLGELGAINPSRMSKLPGDDSARTELFPMSIDNDDFAIMLLRDCCRAYLSHRNIKFMDNYSALIQHILAKYKVSPKARSKMNIWAAVPEIMRTHVECLLVSRYEACRNEETLGFPLFRTSRYHTAHDWSIGFISEISASVTDKELKKFFDILYLTCRNDATILLAILPYVLLESLQNNAHNSTEHVRQEIDDIFNAVLKGKTPKPPIQVDTDFYVPSVNCNRKSLVNVEEFKCESNDIAVDCARIIMLQIDFLEHWLYEYENRESCGVSQDNYDRIKKFYNGFNKKILAEVNLMCKEYTRALKHIEAYIEEENKDQRLANNLSMLAKIYAELLDQDTLACTLNMKEETTLQEQILISNVSGEISETLRCYEQLMKLGPLQLSEQIGLVGWCLESYHPNLGLLVSNGLLQPKQHSDCKQLLEARAEPLLQLADWSCLNDLIQTNELNASNNWGIRCGQILLNYRNRNKESFAAECQLTRQSVLEQMTATGIELNNYKKSYSYIMKLHLITEMEKTNTLVSKIFQRPDKASNLLSKLFTELDERLQIIQTSAKVLEPVLGLRRILLQETATILREKSPQAVPTIEKHIGMLLIRSMQLARSAGMLHKVAGYAVDAEKYCPKMLFIEKAKLFWEKNNFDTCYQMLERGIAKIEAKSGSSRDEEDQQLLSEAKCLLASYHYKNIDLQQDLNYKLYEEAIAAYNRNEDTLVQMAQYQYNQYMAMAKDEKESEKGCTMLLNVAKNYILSLQYGCKYMFQSLPRTLSIWLDLGSKGKISRNLDSCAKEMITSVPSFILYSAFSQLISRICHPSDLIFETLKEMIVKLIEAYPQQCLWMLMSSNYNMDSHKQKRCAIILKQLQKNDPLYNLINDFKILFERLIIFTRKLVPKSALSRRSTSLSMKQFYPILNELIVSGSFSKIMLPIKKFMQPIIPPVAERHKCAQQHNAFPDSLVYIASVQDTFSVMISGMHPKKITFIGSDGKSYGMLTKDKDDLRIDCRMMEFNFVVQQYLNQDLEARELRLGIRMYTAIPLDEKCGIIEWVPNLETLKSVVMPLLGKRGYGLSNSEIASFYVRGKTQMSISLKVFQEEICTKYPPLLQCWFRQLFSAPHIWYEARTSYIRTLAVMSMVGYIVGLGDRHCDNILLDPSNGDIVHVDFNCLFNKGDTLPIKEVVPFRLTRTLVGAMGPLGVRGLFTRACELTMKVMNQNKDVLMAVLQPFIHDELFSVSKRAAENVRNVEQRLDGYIKNKEKHSKLSVSGVVKHCISEATDSKNLAEMYYGWMSFV